MHKYHYALLISVVVALVIVTGYAFNSIMYAIAVAIVIGAIYSVIGVNTNGGANRVVDENESGDYDPMYDEAFKKGFDNGFNEGQKAARKRNQRDNKHYA